MSILAACVTKQMVLYGQTLSKVLNQVAIALHNPQKAVFNRWPFLCPTQPIYQ